MTPNSAEQLLRELCEVCPGRWTMTGDTLWPVNASVSPALYVRDGQIHGGDALWSMLQELRREGLDTSTEEITAEFVIEAFIAWQRARKATPAEAAREGVEG